MAKWNVSSSIGSRERRAADEGDGLADEVRRVLSSSASNGGAQSIWMMRAVLGRLETVTVDDVDVGVREEVGDHVLDDAAVEVGVVGVDPADDLAVATRANALLIASDWPVSGSLRQRTESPAAARMSTLPSVEPPSMTTCSMCGYVWQATERRLSGSHAAWLNDGVRIETSG